MHLSFGEDSQQLVNIVSGGVAPAIVNVDNAVDIGTKQMEVAEKTWPVGFYEPISKKVITMDVTRKYVKIGEQRSSTPHFYSHE